MEYLISDGCYLIARLELLHYICGHLLVLISFADILYDSWSPAMTVSSICISILSMLSSSPAKVLPQFIEFKFLMIYFHPFVYLLK